MLTVDVREYLTADGRNPYREWLDTLDVTPRARIQARVLRFSTGNLGDHKSVGSLERGIRTGIGSPCQGRCATRLLLLGGDKSTQSANVTRAQESWKAYQEGKRRGKTK